MTTSESAQSVESNALGSWTNFISEALTIKAAGYLNEQREKAGVYQTTSANQQETRVNNDGANLTGKVSGAQNMANWLVIGGGILAALVVLVVLFDLFAGKES
jgi:hypothetical protein